MVYESKSIPLLLFSGREKGDMKTIQGETLFQGRRMGNNISTIMSRKRDLFLRLLDPPFLPRLVY